MFEDHELDRDEESGYRIRSRETQREQRKPKRQWRQVRQAAQASQTDAEWKRLWRPTLGELRQEVSEPQSNPDDWKPTYSGSQHEQGWISTYLGPFYQDHQILDVLHQVKGGKEATVYCCRAHPSTGVPLIAAKVYRPRIFRSLRNDAMYRAGAELRDQEGREVRGTRDLRAVRKRTAHGQEVLHTAWLSNEYQTLSLLHQCGADVPQPFASNPNALLMTYVGDEDRAAPILHQVRLEERQAHILFDRLLYNVDLLLAHNRIHGDLSAFNVLYWEGRATLIDMPQAVDPNVNRQAFKLLVRDLQRLVDYFERYGIRANAWDLAREMWRRYQLPE